MKNTMLLTFLLLGHLCAEESLLKNTTLGFSMTPPETEEVKDGVVAMLFLPVKNKFGANVNVMVQTFQGTMDEYNEITQKQFKEMKLRVIESKIDKECIKYEYAGMQNGMDLHFYAKSWKKGDKVYLITATGLEIDWADQKDVLMKSVNSFRFSK